MGMPAAERLLIYELAIQTGLRAGEIYSLTKGRLHLAGSTPTVVVPSDITKDARDAHQGITTELATKLRKHVSGRSPNSKVFSMPKSDSTAKLFRSDVSFVCDEWRKTVAQRPYKAVQFCGCIQSFLACMTATDPVWIFTRFDTPVALGSHWLVYIPRPSRVSCGTRTSN